jgi:hypothetical protein
MCKHSNWFHWLMIMTVILNTWTEQNTQDRLSARDVSQHVVCSCLTTLNKTFYSFHFITIKELSCRLESQKNLISWLLMSPLSINDLFYRKLVIPHIFSSKKGKAKSEKWKKYKEKNNRQHEFCHTEPPLTHHEK